VRALKYFAVGLIAAGVISVIAFLFVSRPEATATGTGWRGSNSTKVETVSTRQPDRQVASGSSKNDGDELFRKRSTERGASSPKATPRETVERARQSGLADDAFLAAKSIRFCQRTIGAGQMARDALVKSGVNLPRSRVDDLMAAIDKPERACQELDAGMLAEYEPMLRQAMAGGLKGAAALWWLTPEANAMSTANSAANARNLLRRDALECDRWSLGAYQMASIRFENDFDPVEAAAVQAAAEQLEKQGKLKGNKSLGIARAVFAPGQTIRAALNKDAVEAKTADILRHCQ
jgi:hypothetical protein